MTYKVVIFTIITYCILLLYSCSKSDKTGIYRTGRVWNFSCYFYDAYNNMIDSSSLQLEIGTGSILSYITNQKELKYSGTCNGRKIKESTGVDEKENMIFIHPPRVGKCFSFTEIPPMPQVELPINMTSVSNIELKVVKAEFEGLNGKTIKQTHRPVRIDTFTFADTTIKCTVITGENTNLIDELGMYKCEFYFNEHYGFVQLNYMKPNGEQVKIVLRKTNFM